MPPPSDTPRHLDNPPEGFLARRLPADYVDTFCIECEPASEVSPDDALIALFREPPAWMNGLLKLRNVLVKPFGLASGKGWTCDLARAIRRREPCSIMSVPYKSTAETVILGEDKHLNFYLSLRVRPVRRGGHGRQRLTAVTLVQYSSPFGKVYFFFIRPFHQLIVPALLKRAARQLEQKQAA